MNNIEQEILDNFIPQIYYARNGQTLFKWNRGNSYVEVRIPSYKIGKGKRRSQIISNIGRTYENRVTRTDEYDFRTLAFLLKTLNRK